MIKLKTVAVLPDSIKKAFNKNDTFGETMYFTLQHGIFFQARSVFYINYCVAASFRQLYTCLDWNRSVTDQTVISVLKKQLSSETIISDKDANELLFHPVQNVLSRLPNSNYFSVRVIHSINYDNLSAQQRYHFTNMEVKPFVITVTIPTSASKPFAKSHVNSDTGVYGTFVP